MIYDNDEWLLGCFFFFFLLFFFFFFSFSFRYVGVSDLLWRETAKIFFLSLKFPKACDFFFPLYIYVGMSD